MPHSWFYARPERAMSMCAATLWRIGVMATFGSVRLLADFVAVVNS